MAPISAQWVTDASDKYKNIKESVRGFKEGFNSVFENKVHSEMEKENHNNDSNCVSDNGNIGRVKSKEKLEGQVDSTDSKSTSRHIFNIFKKDACQIDAQLAKPFPEAEDPKVQHVATDTYLKHSDHGSYVAKKKPSETTQRSSSPPNRKSSTGFNPNAVFKYLMNHDYEPPKPRPKLDNEPIEEDKTRLGSPSWKISSNGMHILSHNDVQTNTKKARSKSLDTRFTHLKGMSTVPQNLKSSSRPKPQLTIHSRPNTPGLSSLYGTKFIPSRQDGPIVFKIESKDGANVRKINQDATEDTRKYKVHSTILK